jgi:outer membrane immunogenic protein
LVAGTGWFNDRKQETTMNKLSVLATAITASMLSIPAFAGNLNAPKPEPQVATPAPAPVAMPAAFDWTGGYIGANLGYDNISSNAAASGNGAIGGLHAGYNYSLGNFVVGGELSADAANIGLNGGGKLSSLTALKLRAGVPMDRTLVYATVGAVQGSGNIAGASITRTGGLIGAGVDYAMTDHWVVGGELDYSRINNADKAGTNLENTSLVARVSYKF